MQQDAPQPAVGNPAQRNDAVWVVLASGLVALFLGPAALGLVREQLHIRCSMGPPGSEGADTWACSDGIGYLGVAVTLGAMWVLAVLLGSLVAGLVRRDRTARVLLVLLAGASMAWILGWTWYGARELVEDENAPLTGSEYWQLAVGPAAIVGITSLAAAALSLFLPARSARIVCAAAAVGLLGATVLQPGLSINTVPAAALLTAAAIRATA